MKLVRPPSVQPPTLTLLRIFNHLTGIVLGCLCVGIAGGYVSGDHAGFKAATDPGRLLPGPIRCNPGPWGELIYTPFTISAPDEVVPVRSLEETGTRWFLAGYTSDSFVSLLQSTSLTPEQQQEYLSPAVFHLRPDGVELTPSPDLVFALPEDTRAKIYQLLAQSSENDGQVNYIAKEDLGTHFADSGVLHSTMAMFKRVSYERGDYIMYSGVAAILSRIPTYGEKVHFTKALTRQRTMVINLHITPKTDTEALAEYWDKGAWGTDLRTMFHSLAAIPNGIWINILMILPSLPSSELYNFPIAADNPLDGPPVDRDCAWTSFNFFREIPDSNTSQKSYVMDELRGNYRPLNESPRYGDLVVVAKPDGSILHIAIYMADDIWFTKNGSTMVHPWMLASESDVLKQFEFQVDPGQHLLVKYFRNKRI